MLENDIEKHLEAYANSRGCLCLKLVLKNERGWPDRSIITPSGEVGFAELKKPGGGVVSPHQKKWRTELGKRFVAYALIDSKEDAENFVDSLLWKA